ncbi:MAG: hypothetical protein RIF41_14515, partial [Polyangiaceae bacterium]
MTSRHMLSMMALVGLVGLAACGGSTAVDPGAGGSGAGGPGGSTSQGGGGQGGTAQGGNGGTAQGGAGQGGSAQGGGAQGGGSPTIAAECTMASECQLENSCCNCQGLPVSETPRDCAIDCLVPLCEAYVPNPVQADCRVGRCVTNVDCNPTDVICLQPQPQCPPGQTASVAGGCWGPCIPSTECVEVGGCDQCGPNQVCVAEVAQLGPAYHCVALPDDL